MPALMTTTQYQSSMHTRLLEERREIMASILTMVQTKRKHHPGASSFVCYCFFSINVLLVYVCIVFGDFVLVPNPCQHYVWKKTYFNHHTWASTSPWSFSFSLSVCLCLSLSLSLCVTLSVSVALYLSVSLSQELNSELHICQTQLCH